MSSALYCGLRPTATDHAGALGHRDQRGRAVVILDGDLAAAEGFGAPGTYQGCVGDQACAVAGGCHVFDGVPTGHDVGAESETAGVRDGVVGEIAQYAAVDESVLLAQFVADLQGKLDSALVDPGDRSPNRRLKGCASRTCCAWSRVITILENSR